MIETERLQLRRLRRDDLDAMHAYLGDPQTMLYYPAPFTRDFVRSWIKRSEQGYRKFGYGLFGVVLKQSGEFIGDCGLVWQELEGASELEVGYHFRRDHWRNGYATEAARACIEYAFAHAGVDRVISLIRPENLPSRRVAERNGMRIARQVMWKVLLHEVWEIKSVSPSVSSCATFGDEKTDRLKD